MYSAMSSTTTLTMDFKDSPKSTPMKPRPTSLSFGTLKPSGFSPMSVTTPRSRVGTPMQFISETGTPVTPGCKRSVFDTEITLQTDFGSFGPAPSKLMTLDDIAAPNCDPFRGITTFDDEWDEPKAQTCSLDSIVPRSGDIEMRMDCGPQTPGTPLTPSSGRPFGFKKGIRRLARTPGTPGAWNTPLWETEIFVLPEGVTSPFVTEKPFPSDDMWD